MALSNEEQRLLEQMEAALAAEDPKLVNTLRGSGVRRVHRRRATLAGIGFFLGLTLLVLGIQSIVLSVLGFVIMVAAAVTAIYAWQHVGGGPDPVPGRGRKGGRNGSSKATSNLRPNDQGFMDKMEERWKRRRDESGF